MLEREPACNVASWAAAILWSGAAAMVIMLALTGIIYLSSRMLSRRLPPQVRSQ
ncbi:hypothetical protein [Desertibaculum subflavum]|uniref:hypothetical protein n=1 Tax=Desertibaculum subflavum TaxID=2268458 RepID=UPI0013C48F3D